MSKKTADELSEQIGALATDLQRRAAEEVRADIATAIEDQFLGRRGHGREIYRGAIPEDCVLLELSDNPVMQADPVLRAAATRIEEHGLTEDFRAGILFAVRLLADPEYDY
ncbi:hypothetical protein [Nocardia carnea]|uniref:hypothetical protein n=1 Tax=Nocardia carnea TaxID=37328 RepID=UPI0024568C22|nr:hypothetical protein [Nocardia carnea]